MTAKEYWEWMIYVCNEYNKRCPEEIKQEFNTAMDKAVNNYITKKIESGYYKKKLKKNK